MFGQRSNLRRPPSFGRWDTLRWQSDQGGRLILTRPTRQGGVEVAIDLSDLQSPGAAYSALHAQPASQGDMEGIIAATGGGREVSGMLGTSLVPPGVLRGPEARAREEAVKAALAASKARIEAMRKEHLEVMRELPVPTPEQRREERKQRIAVLRASEASRRFGQIESLREAEEHGRQHLFATVVIPRETAEALRDWLATVGPAYTQPGLVGAAAWALYTTRTVYERGRVTHLSYNPFTLPLPVPAGPPVPTPRRAGTHPEEVGPMPPLPSVTGGGPAIPAPGLEEVPVFQATVAALLQQVLGSSYYPLSRGRFHASLEDAGWASGALIQGTEIRVWHPRALPATSRRAPQARLF